MSKQKEAEMRAALEFQAFIIQQKEQYVGNAVAEAMRQRETVEALVDLVKQIIEDEESKGNQCDAHCICCKLNQILEAGR